MIHHLNCASFAPRLVGPMVAHVLLVERPDGLLLVDSGFGTADLADSIRLGRAFKAVMRPVLRPAETALAQVEELGFRADDVTDIVLTHLDLDHAGGVSDFPAATVHVYDAELDAARHPQGMEHGRYLEVQWKDARFATHHAEGDDWFGFESVTVLGDDVLMVPLHGHSRGHALVAVRDPDVPEGWQLHAGDSYFHRGDMTDPPTTPRVLRVVQKVLAQDDAVRVANQARLRELVQAGHPELRIFSAHDPVELEAFAPTAPA
ncbi:MBL fold metallo-hydrolase [Nocardioides sp.]|uniref:MBL fold metallo-hydrolase n=1 Tax=Nocardioides sp. TaxID=35761 RepID=UPI0027180EA4|nr:MBL fold metallo-hydrolase [Nocardioides sp.]MDO9458229.1 MBL fold metallo-hydrolase [Nocardioides sp.]